MDSLELTVRHFSCTRILPGCAHNVGCEISIKKIPLTGEVILCVRDHLQTEDGTTAAMHSIFSTSASSNANSSGSGTSGINGRGSDLDREYMQDISTVRCRAVDEEHVRALEAGDDASGGVGDSSDLDGLSSFALSRLTSSGLASSSSSSSAVSLSPHILLGYRPRFVLCFTGDNHRCLIFETEARHFRDNICATLQHFVRMAKDQHVDELGRFFGDAT